MLKTLEMTGENRDAAIEAALAQLGMDRDDVSVEVLDNGKKGFLGIGATPARVRISYEGPDEPAAPAVPAAPAPKKPAEPKTEQKLSITTDDTTPRLVKKAPEGFRAEKTETEQHERSERRERGERRERPRSDRPRREPRPVTPSVPRERTIVPVSEAGMQQAETLATGFISGLLEKMGIEGTLTTLPQVEADQLRISVSGPDMGQVIGRRGDTLDAIQYLTSLVLNNAMEEHVRLSVDTENYREKRRESLERLARKMALKVQKSHRSMTLEPMNPYERRIIHATLQDFGGVTTYSTGTEPNRRVVVAPDSASHSPRR